MNPTNKRRAKKMSKKYRVVTTNEYYDCLLGLKVGDIVTKIEGSNNDLYELPKHLRGRGHSANILDGHLNLKKPNYAYIPEDYLEEIKDK